MDDTYSVDCEAPGKEPGLFTGLTWNWAMSRCETERVKAWERVRVRCEATGAVLCDYPGTLSRVRG